MAELTVNLLGPPRFEVERQPIEIRRRKAVALLAYLAVTGQPHTRAALAALLWPEASARRAGASLRSALWALNKTPLGAWLSADAETIAFETGTEVAVDAAHFRELIAAPRQHRHPPGELCAECAGPVSEAVALYQGDFLAGFTLPDAPAFDEWQFFQADSLRELLASALEQLARYHRAAGDLDRAIDYGRRLAALDPLHEPAHQALLKLYAEAGRQTAALRQYDLYSETLAAELGVEPSSELTALYEQIRRGAWPEPQPSRAAPHNLPPEPTPLVGREDERRQIAAFLDDPATRLLTISGPGGMGKTRLALAAAADALTRAAFADGVYFVPLAPVSEPEAMLSLIAETVGYPLQSDPRSAEQQLYDYFRRRAMLLVLDNFEQLLPAASFIAGLLQRAPQVRVLVTSRERLNLYEEQQIVLGGLAVPAGQAAATSSAYPAAALFLQSARRRRPDFEVAPADRPHLATICRLVEGMPLALELAAAWAEMLPLGEIAAEIRHNLDFLQTTVRNVPDRHRSIRAVFDVSWQRLDEPEQRVYAGLSVFRGSFTAAAARAVVDASLQTLRSLASQSLLRPVPEAGRYELHELLRQYAAARLEEADAERTLDRHASYYTAFLHAREAELKGARQPAALGEIEADLDNADAAWRWAVARQHLALLEQALDPLALYYRWHGRVREGRTLCRLAIDALTPPEDDARRSHLLLKLLTWQSVFDLASANYEAAERSLQRARALLESPALRGADTRADEAFLLLQLSEATKRQAFSGDALALNEQSLALYRSIDDGWGVTQALDALSARHQGLGNYELAVELQRECLAISQELGDPRGIARAHSSLGHNILFTGQLEVSERYLRRSLALFRELDDRAGQRLPLLILGINLLFAGRFEASIDSFEACWAIHRELGMPHEPASANVGIARALINLGRYEEARRLSEADLARYRSLQHTWYIAFALFNLGRIALAEGEVGQADRRLAESAALLRGMGDRPLLPDVLFCQALVQRRQGSLEQARQSMAAGLRLALESVPLSPMRFELPAMALLLVDEGDTARAVELYAAAQQSPYIANSVWFETVAGEEVARAADALPPGVVAAAETRGRERDLLATAAALLAELEPGPPGAGHPG